MKLILFTFIGIFFSCQTSLAQCKLHTITDDFDGSVAYKTKQIKIASDGIPGILKGGGYMDCSFKTLINFFSGKGKIVLIITERSELCDCTPASISFKFSNNSIFTKSNVRYGQEKTLSGNKSEQYSYFDLTKDELIMLSKMQIAKFRMNYQNCSEHSVIDDDMTGKDSEEIQESAKCLLENIGKK